MTDLARTIGPAILLLRQRRRMPQKQLASRAGVTRAMLSGIERGRRLPSVATLAKLLAGLGATVHDLARALDVVQQAGGRRS